MVCDPRGGHNRKQVCEDFFKTWSPRMAYVLGFIYADGALLNTNDSSRTYYLSFANNDLDLLEQIRHAMNSSHQIHLRPARKIKIRNKIYISKPSYSFRIGNKNMYQDLINLGMQHQKSNIMEFPNVPPIYFSFFIRGYFDGDGCVSWYLNSGRKYPSLRVLFTSGSNSFLQTLAILASKYWKIPLGHVYTRFGAHNLVFQGSSAMRLLDNIYSHLKEAPYLKYKLKKYVFFKGNLVGPRVRKALLEG